MILALGLVGAAGDAFAQTSVDGLCGMYTGFFAKIVPCIGTVVINATQYYLVNYIGYFVATMNVVLTFAVLLYGFMLYTGRARSASREGFILMLKIGGVGMVMGVLADLYPTLVETMMYLVEAVSFYLPTVMYNQCPYANGLWEILDCSMAHLVGGVFPGITVAHGLLGFLVASLFSGPAGVATFFLGISMILVMLYTLFQAVFVMLATLITMSLLMGVAPLMIPLLALRVTKGYFEKWLRLLMTVILQPMFLFAYLTMMMIMMEAVIFSGPFSLYRAIACDAVDGNWGATNFSIGNYISSSGAAAERNSYTFSVNQSPTMLPAPSGSSNTGTPGKAATTVSGGNITSLASVQGRLMGNIGVKVPSVALNYEVLAGACGESTQDYMLKLLFAFVMAAAITYVMYTLIGVIPYLGASMTGELFGVQQMVTSQFSKMGGMDKVMSTLTGGGKK